MKKTTKIRKKLELFVIFILLGVIFWRNYIPGTFLAGWDNLMPELNIWLNLKRAVLGAWQEYQGLGLVSGMAHSADLVRQLVLLPFSLILPASFIRYFWVFVVITLGTLGIYFNFGGLWSSLFYLLNFGAIQIFWPPYEAFITFWGFFPWLISIFLKLLKNPSPRNWRWFLLLNILAIPSFYLQTLFVVYVLCLTLLTVLVNLKSQILNFKIRIFKSYLLIILINAFWLLPFSYFLLTNSYNPQLALANRLTSEQTFFRNQKRGTFGDFLLLRGYYYDFSDAGVPLMKIWQEHFNNKLVLFIGYTFGLTCLIGLVSAPRWLKGLFLLSVIAFLSAVPPFSWINWLFRQSPFLNQVFRSPFTKFIAPATFTFSLLFAYGINFLRKTINKLNLHELIHVKQTIFFALGTALILSAFVIYSFPVFKGDFIYSKMRVKIPNDYFELFKFLKTQPKTARIADLPQGSFWGWTFYRWGLRGSGFIWYGIEQPILDRAFDVWNLNNEQYWRDLNYAIQNQNLALLEKVFEKYVVELVIFDDNVIFPESKIYAKSAIKTEEMLKTSRKLEKIADFGEIAVYHFFQPTFPYIVEAINSINFPDFKKYKVTGSALAESANIQPEFKRCNGNLIGEHSYEISSENEKIFHRLTARDGDACLSWWFSEVPLNQGLLVEFNYRTIKGHLPLVSAFDGYEKYQFFYEKLEETKNWQKAGFIIPPAESENKGLAVSFSTPSFNQFESINDIAAIKVFPVSFESEEQKEDKPVFLDSKGNLWFYQTKLNEQILNFKCKDGDCYLTLPQSFDRGWQAFYLDGLKPVFLKEHLLINNWANGWKLPVSSEQGIVNSQENFYIVFWPQILEFLGFGLLLVVILKVFVMNRQV